MAKRSEQPTIRHAIATAARVAELTGREAECTDWGTLLITVLGTPGYWIAPTETDGAEPWQLIPIAAGLASFGDDPDLGPLDTSAIRPIAVPSDPDRWLALGVEAHARAIVDAIVAHESK
jgi:hypothetical protein